MLRLLDATPEALAARGKELVERLIFPDVPLFVMRVGHKAAYRLGGRFRTDAG